MMIKQYCQRILMMICILLCSSHLAHAALIQSLQINTAFLSVVGSPSWVIILRDVDTGQVFPYLYDVKKNKNYWIALEFGHSYRVVASRMQFDVDGAEIANFCHLENGIISDHSMIVSVKGRLSPCQWTSSCKVAMFRTP